MSSRVLRKLQGEKELTEEIISDPESDLPVSGGARRKQLNINRYDLLNQQSHSESEVKEDDNETEANNAHDGTDCHEATKRKKKKKKKKSGKSMSARRSSEDNVDVDEIERSVREVNKLLGESDTTGLNTCADKSAITSSNSVRKSVLNIQHRNLNPNNELKRIFGSKVFQSEQIKRRGRGRGHIKTTWLVSAKDNWPQVGKPGLSMSLVENKNGSLLFTYEHNTNYQQIQMRFLEAVESLDPDNIVAIINDYPYHVDALIQLSDLCKMSEDLAMAAELIERALFCLECAFHPLFNIAQGNCRLDYRKQENRALFITVFKHLIFVGGRACYRTALEFCKLLLSLDPDGDPLGVVLAIDFYAIRSREYAWLIQFFEEWEPRKNLSQLPNFAFSIAIAHYQLATSGACDTTTLNTEMADMLLQNALIMFPGVLTPLLEKCSVQPDSRVAAHSYFGSSSQTSQSQALSQLVQLYVCRGYHVWKEVDLLVWLERNVIATLDRVDLGTDPLVTECVTRRAKRYQGTPRNISRHILLSDFKEVTAALPADSQGPVLSFDPLPPLDSVNLYTRPKAPRVQSNASAMSMFFQSLLPNFNINDHLAGNIGLGDEGALRGAGQGGGDGGAEGSDTGGVDLRRSVTSLLDAMRDLLSNIRLPDVPNDADVDENDSSDTDDQQNNYLT